MQRIIYFLCFVSIPALFLCQAPGYMGKKTTVGGGIHFNPVTYGATANNTTLLGSGNGSAKTGRFSLNLTYDVFAERVISKRWLFGTSLKYIRTGYDNRSQVMGSNFETPTDYYKINAFCINPYFKHYSRHYPAPLGKYFLIGPSVNLISTKHDNYMHLVETTGDGHDTLMMFNAPKQMHFSFDLILGWGKSRIINDRILIDYGCNFGVLAIAHVFEAFDSELLAGKPSKEEYINLTAKSRLRNATRFNVFLRVAYLF